MAARRAGLERDGERQSPGYLDRPGAGQGVARGLAGRVVGDDTNLRPSTAARDQDYVRLYVSPRFGSMPLASIGQRDVRAWVADRTAHELAPATVVKAYHLLGKVLVGAVDTGMIAQSPCRRI